MNINNIVLQYVFFMDEKNRIITCDESGQDFLTSIDSGIFYAQLNSLKINSAVTNTTIILNSRSYNLRMVPTDTPLQITSTDDNTCEIEYLIILQDQTLFSYVYQKINQIEPDIYSNTGKKFIESDLANLFNSSSSGIFMTNSIGNVIYANKAYANTTNLPLDSLIGKKITDLGATGMLNPLITPVILETHTGMTTLQKLGTGKNAIISGAPIYNSTGETALIITCVNVITKIVVADLPELYYDPSSLDFNINKRAKEHSIDIIAESPIMKALLQEAIKVAQYNVTVLILGETGVGKEIIASIIHASSKLNNEKFVKINCSAIAPSLLESELFGYEAGSFTGASSHGKSGLFEVAQNGTILLDEIGDMPIELQAKLLRVIQSREFYRVGGITPIKSNARIIAATNKNIEMLIKEGKFREDLYYRLNVVSVNIPPLRERKEDIKPLLLHFCYYFNKKHSTNKLLSDEFITILEEYHWPGNIRELQNLIERLTVLCLEDYILPEHLYSKYTPIGTSSTGDEDIQVNGIIPLKVATSSLERILVSKAMEKYKSTRKAAEILQVSQSTIMRKVKELEIQSNS